MPIDSYEYLDDEEEDDGVGGYESYEEDEPVDKKWKPKKKKKKIQMVKDEEEDPSLAVEFYDDEDFDVSYDVSGHVEEIDDDIGVELEEESKQ